MNNTYYIPCVVRETAEGLTRVPIQDLLFQRRSVELVGEVTGDSVHSLTLQLRYLQLEDPNAEITIYINSPGGEVSSGLALYDVMKGLSCPVKTVCMGTAASMAALLFVAGSQREMLPHSRLMIHDPLIPGGVGGSALKLDSIAKDLMRTREITANILAGHSGHSLEEVYAKTAADSYFSAEEAVAWGLADRITDKI